MARTAPKRPTTARLAFAIAALAATAIMALAATGPAEAARKGMPPALTTSQIAIVTDQEDPLFTEGDARYRYIVIRDNLHDRVDELREVHPEAQIILYKNVGFTLHEPGCPYEPYQGGGVSWCDADPNEDWFLHDASGNRLVSEGYAAQRAMNIAHPGYRHEWLESVRQRLSDAENDGSGVRYDGVWMDDTNLYPGHGMDGRIAELTDAEYRNAMVGFIDEVAPALRSEGFVTMVNLGMNPWEPAERSAALQVAGDVSAVNREGLVRWGEGALFTEGGGAAPHWKDEVKLAEALQRRGSDFHAITYGGSQDLRIQRYARATFLMAWNGRDGSAFAYRSLDGGTSYKQGWTTDIGVPTRKRRAVGQGWVRRYTGGTAIVHPRPSGKQRFRLHGRHRAPSGACVRSIKLKRQSALVLPRC